MLFYLNDQAYEQRDMEDRWRVLENQPALSGCRRLAVCTQDQAEWLAIAFYCREKGLSAAPIHPDTPQISALTKAKQLDCDALIWQSAANIQRLERVQQLQTQNTDSPTGTLIQFSSGTTGEPKCIERSWPDIDTEIRHYNRALNLPPDVIPVVACPVTHSYGLICGLLAPMARGAVPHIVTGWNPKHLLRTVKQYRKPMLYASPTFIATLLMLWPDGPPLHGVMTSGSLMSQSGFANLIGKATHVWQQYGCSEAGCISIARQPESADVMGTALGHCELVAGHDSESPEEVIVQQGQRRIHTGDAGYLDSNGALHFCGRMDDTIISAGLNVYPQEVEEALMTHPDIREAVVFKLPDPLAGERVAVVYTGDAPLTDKDLRALYRQGLAPYQWPSWARHINQIPRMPSGKISRRKLAAQFAVENPDMKKSVGQQPGATSI